MMKHVNPVAVLAAVALVSLGLLSAQAQGQSPGGNGQIDQYTETLPGAGGDEPTAAVAAVATVVVAAMTSRC